jgi:tRNA G18 (ribose-2'-O)-methylase SpoU
MRKLTVEEIARKRLSPGGANERFPIWVLLDNIRSLYNVGSIFRSCDGARISRLILCGYTPHPPRREIEKTALGATQSVPWEYVKEPLAAIASLKSQGIRLCVLEQADGSRPYYTLTRDLFPLCLVVGNEITGVSERIMQEADLSVEIPMFGVKQSLNAAVALGIGLYELVRIWKDGEETR